MLDPSRRAEGSAAADGAGNSDSHSVVREILRRPFAKYTNRHAPLFWSAGQVNIAELQGADSRELIFRGVLGHETPTVSLYTRRA